MNKDYRRALIVAVYGREHEMADDPLAKDARNLIERLRAENKRHIESYQALKENNEELAAECARLTALFRIEDGELVIDRIQRERDAARLEREQLRVWKSTMMQSVASFVRNGCETQQQWWCDEVRRADAEMAKVTSLEDCVTVQLNAAGDDAREPFMQDLSSGVITDED